MPPGSKLMSSDGLIGIVTQNGGVQITFQHRLLQSKFELINQNKYISKYNLLAIFKSYISIRHKSLF